MAEIRRVLQVGGILMSRGVQGRLAYASYFLLDLAAFFISFGLTLMLWLYVDEHKPGGLPISRNAIISYLTLALVVNFAKSIWMDNVLGGRIRSGQVATDLLKPMDFQWMYFFMSMGDVLIQTVMATGVLALSFYFLPEPPLALEPVRLGIFALSLGLGILVQYGICFFFTLGAFFTHNGYGIFFMRLMLHQAFSGIFAPLMLYPESLQAVAKALPFHAVVHSPVLIGLGWTPLNGAPALLLEQALWAAGLLLAGQFAFRAIVGRLSIQGG